MTDAADDAPPPRPRRAFLFWGAAATLAAAGGAGAFLAGRSGLAAPLLGATADGATRRTQATTGAPRFVELDPALVAVGSAGSVRQLRFRAFLEIAPEAAEVVAPLAPRLLDVSASYLRALEVEVLEDPSALMRIRAQLLRRVQLLAGPDAVKDLLIVEFVIT